MLDAARRRGEWLVERVVEVSTAGRAPRQNPAIFALAAAAASATTPAARPRSPRSARSAAPARTCSCSPATSSSSAAGVAACAGRSPAGTSTATSTTWPTRRSSTGSGRAGPTATCCAWRTRRPRTPRGARCSAGSSGAHAGDDGPAAGEAFERGPGGDRRRGLGRAGRAAPAVLGDAARRGARRARGVAGAPRRRACRRPRYAPAAAAHPARRARPADAPPGRRRAARGRRAAAPGARAPGRTCWSRCAPTPPGRSRAATARGAGPAGRRRAGRGVLRGVRDGGAGRQAHPARAGRVRLHGGAGVRAADLLPGGVGGARAGHCGHRAGHRRRRVHRRWPRLAHGAAELRSARGSASTTRRAVSGLPFGGTDCALPMVWALEKRPGVRHVRRLHRQRDVGRRDPPAPGAGALPGADGHRTPGWSWSG